MSQVHRPLKIKIQKYQDVGLPIRLRDPLCIIMTYCNSLIFTIAAVRHLEILKIEFF